MRRTLLLALLFPLLFIMGLRASEVIPPPSVLVSPEVAKPHVTVNFIASAPSVEPGKTVTVALHLKMQAGWHTYWINPGEAGLATIIKWTLPPGWTAGPIQWPTPENHTLGGVVTFGYEGDAYLLVDLTAPADWKASAPADLKAHVTWLVCEEECVPGSVDLSLSLPGDAKGDFSSVDQFFAAARARVPKPAPWTAKGAYTASALTVTLTGKPTVSTTDDLYFYPEQPNVISANQPDLVKSVTVDGDKSVLPLPLQTNGDTPTTLSGVLVTNVGKANQEASYVASFPVTPPGTATSADSTTTPSNPVATSTSSSEPSTPTAPSGPQSDAAYSYDVFVAVGAAFLGGLILNLMPCVLPVLALKVHAIIKHSQGGAWKQGLAYSGGVLVSFWLLAGILLVLRATSDQVGWGFQLSSPGFVLFLTALFFVLALNLFGVFDVGNSLVGLDARSTNKLTGLTSAFANGALATLAATPCTGPFMGSSLGFAAQQPAYVAILIFTSLALGMASPFLLLTCYPPLMRYLPKPGAWMESFRQFLGFLLILTVVWFGQVFGALVGMDQVSWLLALLVFLGMACWIYGRFIQPPTAKNVARPTFALGLVAVAAIFLAIKVLSPEEAAWQPYSADAVSKSLKDNRPVFVDFTASWCLSCKVNEAVALSIPSTMDTFHKNNVVLLRGDWTKSDPEITKVLHQYNRDGVPMYLLYSPKNPTQPQVLPEVLTPGLVQNAVNGL